MNVIGLDEKDIDKALIDGNGMPVRAPRDMKAGDSFWVYMGPSKKVAICPMCQVRQKAEEESMAEITKGLIVFPDKV